MCNYIVYKFNDLAVSYKLYREVINSILKLQYFPEGYPDLSHYGITNKKYRRLRVGKIIILYRIDYFNR